MSNEAMSRRDFLVTAGAATAGAFLLTQELFAQTTTTPAAAGSAGIGVIGIGSQGKEILSALSKIPGANVAGICDTYEPAHKKALEIAPKAVAYTDYKKLLESKDIQAVFIATPTFSHKQIALDAIAAGKHVYCEAPLAGSIEDAKVIAKAALAAKTTFQVGLHYRSDPLRNHVLGFVKNGVLGKLTQVKAHWHKKNDWKSLGSTPEREADLAWKVKKATSTGLLGEIGIHQLDMMSWYLASTPVSITAFGGTMLWTDDGRDVADTVQAIVEYPNNMRLVYDVTLTSSVDGIAESLHGSESSILLRPRRAWMVKEADASALGWEVYARKDKIGDEEGIALIANATKLLAAGKEPGKDGVVDDGKNATIYACEEFLKCVTEGAKPIAGPEVGFQSAVTAIKANEALLSGSKLVFQKEWYDLG